VNVETMKIPEIIINRDLNSSDSFDDKTGRPKQYKARKTNDEAAVT